MNFIEVYSDVLSSFVGYMTDSIIGHVVMVALSVVLFCICIRSIIALISGPRILSDDSTPSEDSTYVIKLNGEEI